MFTVVAKHGRFAASSRLSNRAVLHQQQIMHALGLALADVNRHALDIADPADGSICRWARIFVFAYTLLGHLLVFWVLARYSHLSSQVRLVAVACMNGK